MENNNLQFKPLTITVSGPVASGKSTLLSIIKTCLERDYVFRTQFANVQIELKEKVEGDDTQVLSNKELADLEDKVDESDEV